MSTLTSSWSKKWWRYSCCLSFNSRQQWFSFYKLRAWLSKYISVQRQIPRVIFLSPLPFFSLLFSFLFPLLTLSCSTYVKRFRLAFSNILTLWTGNWRNISQRGWWLGQKQKPMHIIFYSIQVYKITVVPHLLLLGLGEIFKDHIESSPGWIIGVRTTILHFCISAGHPLSATGPQASSYNHLSGSVVFNLSPPIDEYQYTDWWYHWISPQSGPSVAAFVLL